MSEWTSGIESLADLNDLAAVLMKWTMLLAVAWCFHVALRRANPRWRVLVWRAFAIGLLVVPVCHLVAPTTIELVSTAPERVAVAITPLVDEGVAEEADVAGPGAAEPGLSFPMKPPSDSALDYRQAGIAVLICVLAAGIVIGVSRTLIGCLQIRGLRRRATAPTASVESVFQQVVSDLAIRRSVVVRVSDEVTAPTLCGLIRPTVLIPERAQFQTYSDELPAIFAHELAHVRSRDVNWNFAFHWLRLVLWFHPLAWIARVGHASACESVSDAVAASYTGSVRDYSRTLARVALDAHDSPRLALGMARTSDVRRRIESLHRTLFAKELRPMATVVAVLILSLMCVMVGGFKVAQVDAQEPEGPQQRESNAVDAEQRDGQQQQVGQQQADSNPAIQRQNRLASMVTDETQGRIDKSFAYLVSRQRQNGSFGDAHSVAVTSVCGLAFLSEGSSRGKGKFGEQLSKCEAFVLSQAKPDGLIAGKSGLIYVHAYAIQFLSESHIARPSPQTLAAINKGVKLLVDCQNDSDGWRYQTTSRDADTSASSCVLVALAAARRAGADVPAETTDRATKYLLGCQNDDGGFSYTGGPGSPSGLPRSAAAMAAILAVGGTEKESAQQGLGYLRKQAAVTKPGDPHFFYGEYYMSMAMRHSNNRQFRKWYELRSKQLAETQADDGTWKNSFAGPEYSTAKACVILQSPRRTTFRLKE